MDIHRPTSCGGDCLMPCRQNGNESPLIGPVEYIVTINLVEDSSDGDNSLRKGPSSPDNKHWIGEEATSDENEVAYKFRTLYGIFRLVQIFFSVIELGLVFALIAVDYEYRLYSVWLMPVPAVSIIIVLLHLFARKLRISNACSDIIQAVFNFAQGIVVVCFYMFLWERTYWDYRSDFFFPVATSAAVFCFVLSLLFWVTGCSSACCHCLNDRTISTKKEQFESLESSY